MVATRAMRAEEYEKIVLAASCLNQLYGVTLNAHIIVNYDLLGVRAEFANAFCRSMNAAIARYLECWRGQMAAAVHAYVFVHEVGKVHGLHLHELLYLPDGLAPRFRRWLRQWVARRAGLRVCPPKAMRIPVRCTSQHRMVRRQWLLVRYMGKSLEVRYPVWGDEGIADVRAAFSIRYSGKLSADPCVKAVGVATVIGAEVQRALCTLRTRDVAKLYTGWEMDIHGATDDDHRGWIARINDLVAGGRGVLPPRYSGRAF